MKTIKIYSIEDTYELANKLSQYIKGNFIITMSGDLGAGKTTFTKALAKSLGINKTISSPTFTILKSYNENNVRLHHIDAYRLEGIDQDLGFEEVFEEEALIVIEWYKFVEDTIPNERLELQIELMEDCRLFKFTAIGRKYEQVLEEI